MSEETIVKGPPDDNFIPLQSIGITLFDAIKKAHSNRTILVDEEMGKTLSYGNLWKYSVTIAVQLKKYGLQKGDIVTIISPNSWKSLLIMISAYYNGLVINPLNPDYSVGELKHFFSVCAPKCVVTCKNILHKIQYLCNESKHLCKIILLDYANNTDETIDSFDGMLQNSEHIESFFPVSVVPEKDAALILTSSGTTGLPKCVLLSHKNCRAQFLFFGHPLLVHMAEDESTIGNMPFFHAWGIVIAIGSILNQIKLVILPRFEPHRFLRCIENHKVTKIFTAPPVVVFLAKTSLVDNYNLSSLKEVFCGTSILKENIESMVIERLKLKHLYQLYGMTELSGAVTLSPKVNNKCGSVGKLLPTFELKVCHVQTGASLGPYEKGELRLRGDGLMMQYLKNKSLAILDEDGFLKSGDLGYYDDEGLIYVVDRLKDIIKYKGFQVAPAEIETLLIQHPSVRDAGVIGIPDENAGELPLAFVVKESEVTESEIVQYIADKICKQKHLHGGVRFVDHIPKTSSGKIWRRKLREYI